LASTWSKRAAFAPRPPAAQIDAEAARDSLTSNG
jgi:hypothetical protein